MTEHTADQDPVWTFLQHLPARTRAAVHRTERLVVLIHRATRDHDWTPKQLAQECARDHNGAINPGAIVIHRLQHAANNPPAAAPTGLGPAVPFCTPDCQARAGWIEDDNGRPIQRCPCRTPTEVPA